MSRHLKTAKSLNTAVFVLSIIGVVWWVLVLFFGAAIWGSANLNTSYLVFAGAGVSIISVIYLAFCIFSIVCACVISSNIKKGIAGGAPFVLAILNAVFSGLSGRYVTMVLAIITAVKLNAAKKESLPNI